MTVYDYDSIINDNIKIYDCDGNNDDFTEGVFKFNIKRIFYNSRLFLIRNELPLN
jgi:hypothetical protein